MLMDVGLPDTDGREVVRSLRKAGFKVADHRADRATTPISTRFSASNPARTTMWRSLFRFAVAAGRIHAQLRQHDEAKTRCFRSALLQLPSRLQDADRCQRQERSG